MGLLEKKTTISDRKIFTGLQRIRRNISKLENTALKTLQIKV